MTLADQINNLATRIGTEFKSVRSALALKAPIASPAFTGSVSSPPMPTFTPRTGQYDKRNNIYTPVGCRGLPAFNAALAKVRAGSATDRATIGLVGHSLLAGYLSNTVGMYDPGSQLRKALSQTFGVRAGTGIVPTFNGDTTGVTDDVRYSKTGTWSYLGSAGNILPWAFSNTGPPTLTFTSNTPGTVVDIMVADNFGNYTYSIDGAAAVTVTVGGTSAWNMQTITGLADTTHTVVLSGATLVPVGVNVRYPSDLEVHNFGNVGTAASDWAPGATSWSTSLGAMLALAPKVSVIMLGHAELFAGTSAATYKTNMQTIITALKAAGSDILIVGAIPRDAYTDAQWLPYREALLDLADTNQCLLADPYQAFGSYVGGSAIGLYAGGADPAHLTNAGSTELVRVISSAFVGDAPAGPFGGGVAGTPSTSKFLRGDNSWADPEMIGNPAQKNVRTLIPMWTNTAITSIGISPTAVGTATQASFATTNKYQSSKRLEYLVTVAATTAVAGWRGNAAEFWRGNAAGLGGFKVCFRSGVATGAVSTHRMFTGLTAATANPTDVQPSTLVDMIGVGYDAADTQLYVMHNDSSGAATKVATGIPRVNTDRTQFFTLTISCTPNASTLDVTVKDEVSGITFTTTVSTNLPSNTVGLCTRSWASVGGVSSVIGMSLFGFYAESAT